MEEKEKEKELARLKKLFEKLKDEHAKIPSVSLLETKIKEKTKELEEIERKIEQEHNDFINTKVGREFERQQQIDDLFRSAKITEF